MLQECNKFREHQARELLIELLEHQLEERQALTKELKNEIAKADKLLLSKTTTTTTTNSSTPSLQAAVKSESSSVDDAVKQEPSSS